MAKKKFPGQYRLPAALLSALQRKQIEEAAVRQGCTMSDVLRQFIDTLPA